MCFFADYLCGLEKPIFIYDVQQKLYRPALVSLIESEENQTASKIKPNLSTNSDPSLSEPNSPSVNSTGFDPSSADSFVNDLDMKELKRKKRLLENQLAERQRQEQTVKVNQCHTIDEMNRESLFHSGYSQYIATHRN